MIIKEIKQQIYNLLTEELHYNVADNPYGDRDITFPYVILSVENATREDYKDNVIGRTIRYKIDIFSDYNGELEILNMEQAIYEKMQNLYYNEAITYLRENGFRIIDDKSTGVMRKHGIIFYTIECTGGIEE